jgi:hypothetical protein
MCENPVPCACTLEKRKQATYAHIARQNVLSDMWYRLHKSGQLSEEESRLLQQKIEEEWDDAIHIAASDDPLMSLCGSYGRNLVDLPERPDAWAGCWSCLQRAEKLNPADERELVAAASVSAAEETTTE